MNANEDTVHSMADLLHNTSDSREDCDDDSGSVPGSTARQDSLNLHKNKSGHNAGATQNDVMDHDDIGEFDGVEPSLITGMPDVEALSTRGLPSCFERELKLKIFVGILFVVMVVSLAVIFSVYNKQKYEDSLGNRILLDELTRQLSVENVHREEVLRGHLGRKLPEGVLPYDCTASEHKQTQLCLRWKQQAQLDILYHEEADTNCYDVAWTTLDRYDLSTPKDCWELDWGQWYGLGLMPNMSYPLNNVTMATQAFTTGSMYTSPAWGPVVDRYILMSQGVALYVHPESPLHISINEPVSGDSNTSNGMLCMYAHYMDSPYPQPPTVEESKPSLNYTICVGPTIKHVHQVVLDNFHDRPTQRPADNVFNNTVWSTYAYYQTDYSQSVLESYTQGIQSRNYSHGLLVIEDGWQHRYGDLTFDPQSFPIPSSMLSTIRNRGFNIGMWVNPYVNTDADNFVPLIAGNGLAVKDNGGQSPGLSQWYNGPATSNNVFQRGIAATVDMGQPGQQWFKNKLNDFQGQYSDVTSYYFAGGQIDSLPYRPVFADHYPDPNMYVSNYDQLAASYNHQYPSIVESAYRGQSNTLLVRLDAAQSTWDAERGLASIIPKVLTLGLLGYPFILPDPVGGSGRPTLASQELYIRWMQLSTFLPIMHFSRPPHEFNDDTVALAHDLINLHRTKVSKEIVRAAEQAVTSLHPIIRPVWWTSPDDPTALTLDPTQFLVGDCMLVAPVVVEGARLRDIYIPQGVWVDGTTDRMYQGPTWIRNHPVSLLEIAYFTKQC